MRSIPRRGRRSSSTSTASSRRPRRSSRRRSPAATTAGCDRAALAVAHIANVIRNDDGSGALAAGSAAPTPWCSPAPSPSLPQTCSSARVPDRRRRRDRRADPRRRREADRGLRRAARLLAGRGRDLHGSPYDAFLALNDLPRDARSRRDPRWRTAAGSAAVAAHAPPALRRRRHGVRAPRSAVPVRARGARGPEHVLARAPAPPARRTRGRRRRELHRPVTSRRTSPTSASTTPARTGRVRRRPRKRGVRTDRDSGSLSRNLDPDRWLPRTAAHPEALEPFRAVPSEQAPGKTDLGV